MTKDGGGCPGIERSSPQDRAIAQLKLAFDAFAPAKANLEAAKIIEEMVAENRDAKEIAKMLTCWLTDGLCHGNW